MKLHSDLLTKLDVLAAAGKTRRVHHQDILVDEIIACGSRSRRNGVTFYAESLNGKRARNAREGRAATWSAYGYLIAELFAQDPNAIIGQYKGAEDFRAKCEAYQPQGESIAFLEVIA